MIIEMARTGIVKSSAKKSAVADFLLCKATWFMSAIAVAEYPADLTAAMTTFGLISAGAMMCAVSVAKLTVALTPGNALRVRSIAETQAEHVIPSSEYVDGSSATFDVSVVIEVIDHSLMKNAIC